jgi:hypothetical protein
MMLPPREPMRTGGGGAVTELLVCLTVVGAAALSALSAALAPAAVANKEADGDGEPPSAVAQPDD